MTHYPWHKWRIFTATWLPNYWRISETATLVTPMKRICEISFGLLVYDDNRQKLQMEITELLADMVFQKFF
jgi:hypothetical protein